MSVTDQDREKAMELVYDHGPQFPPEEGKGYGDLLTAIAAALAEERQKAFGDVLHWLSEDTDWAREAAGLGEDVALGIDHARRRVVEMRAGRWPVKAS